MSAPKTVKLNFKAIRAAMRDWKKLDEQARKRKEQTCSKQSFSSSSQSTR